MTIEENRFSILCVCTGNICRSPATELLLAAELGTSVAVRSAGTHALVGQPVAGPMDQLLRDFGTDSSAFVARRLTETLLQPTDLVLTMTRAHRTVVLNLWPAAVRRTFTLLEFARLLEGVDPSALPDGELQERLRAAVPLAASRRRQVLDPALDDVVDPYRQSADVYRTAFHDIRRAVDTIIRVVRSTSQRQQGTGDHPPSNRA